MNIEPGMLCILRVPAEANVAAFYCVDCGKPTPARYYQGLLVVPVRRMEKSEWRDAYSYPSEPAFWCVERDDGELWCHGELLAVSERWLVPLPKLERSAGDEERAVKPETCKEAERC